MTDDYQDRLDALYGRINFERIAMPKDGADLRLGRMRRILRKLGDPHLALKTVHVAGTKGKGSTSAMIAAALTASGRKTGLFCSPHLHRIEERFQIDGVDATPAQFVEMFDLVRPAVEEVEATDPHFESGHATFFEVTTAMGLLHFARQNAEMAVVEVGLGGRLDSTNVVRPLVSVLTTISYDHTKQLGNTLALIAREKAGIFKRGLPAVTGVIEDEPLCSIEQVAARRGSPLRRIGRDFRFEFHAPDPENLPSMGEVSVQTWRTDWGRLPLPFAGPHQALNASVALASLDVLDEQGIDISRGAVIEGFRHARMPARVEIFGESPWVVIDGAHNAASARALAETLKTCFPEVPRLLVFGTTRDKDLAGQLDALLPLFDEVVLTRYIENPRAVPPEEVIGAVQERTGRPVVLTSDPAEALRVARGRMSGTGPGLICVTGSLFLAGESRALVLGQPSSTTPAPTRTLAPR